MATLGQRLFGNARRNSEARVQKLALKVRAEAWFRSAGSPLIDEDQIAAGSVGSPRLMGGINGERITRATADIDDRLGPRGLLLALDDDDCQLEAAGVEVIVVAGDADRAAPQPCADLRR